MTLENTPCVVDIWESSYTKGNFEKVTVNDLQQFAKVVDNVNSQQNEHINQNTGDIATNKQGITDNTSAITTNQQKIETLQTQISELQAEIEKLKEGANK